MSPHMVDIFHKNDLTKTEEVLKRQKAKFKIKNTIQIKWKAIQCFCLRINGGFP